MHTAAHPPRFAHEVRSTARLAAPLAAGHVATGLVGFVDAALAGHHSTNALAAVAVGTALFWLPMLVPMGTLMAFPPAVSQLDGAGRRTQIGPLFRQAMWLALGLGALMFALMSLLPLVLAPMGIAADIVPGATAFIHAIRWGIPAFTLTCACVPQRWPALVDADHGHRLWWPAGAGAARLCAHQWPVRPP